MRTYLRVTFSYKYHGVPIPEEVLEDGEERNLLRCILDPVEHGVEHVQVTRQVNIVGACINIFCLFDG